jgi:mono/diheme cytochrome c family protein
MKDIRRPWLRQASRLAVVVVVAGLVSSLTVSGAPLANAEDDQPAEPWTAPRRAARKKNPVPADAQSIRVGERFYERECLPCHGADGRGQGPKAAELDTPPGNLTDPVLWEQSDGALFWKITKGRAPMPAFKTLLTDEQRWSVLNYVRTFAPKKEPVTPPKYDLPDDYRRAASGLLTSYRKAHMALVTEDLAAVQTHARGLAAALENLRQLENDGLGEEVRAQWRDAIEAISKALQAFISSQDVRSLQESFAGLSATLADAIAQFGHAEKTALRLFAAKTEYGGKPATWLQAQREPANPYDGPDRQRQGTLTKALGARYQPNLKGGST